MRHALYIFTALIVICSSQLEAQSIQLGLWRDGRPTERFIYHADSAVTWVVSGGKSHVVPAGSSTYFTLTAAGIRLSTAKHTLGIFKHVKMGDGPSQYLLKSLKPERREERYDQGLEVRHQKGEMRIIAQIDDLDGYVAGVVESESGKEQSLEYYKVQSVISRTYALSKLRRHEGEGFNLCDQVHCQVYHGVSRHNPEVLVAARYSTGQVLVDSELNLVTAAFHSNCGGHTMNSEDVWSKPLSYLKGRPDPYCVEGRHAHWEAQVLKSAWQQFMESESPSPITAEHHTLYSYEAKQRHKSLPESMGGMELKHLRHKWKLNSTYFKIIDEGDKLQLQGRGFGHGVGLCQEGAMGMVAKGFAYPEVLQFYYTDVHLMHLSVLDFFKDN